MTQPPTLESLAARLARAPYEAYTYAYPHKDAYRPLTPALPLADLWRGEDRRALFGYIHLPFCTMRCGFCNLFAMAQPNADLVSRYVDQLIVQMGVMNEVLGERQFARFALGGGTPTYLEAPDLARLLAAVRSRLGADLSTIPSGIEASPETITPERLAVCREAGLSRLSLGIQSFADHEVRHLARPQQRDEVIRAIEQIRAARFPVLNLDLIYGIPGQTVASFLASLDSALAFRPEELYLYPLYVRPATGLGQRLGPALPPLVPGPDQSGDSRMALYLTGRDHLRAAGYEQVSMRMFRAPHAPVADGPAYCCQNDGMVGFGAGARSYTQRVHHATAYAVRRGPTRDIITDWLARTPAELARADHGFILDRSEQQRRFLIQSLLAEPGLSETAYRDRFGNGLANDWPVLGELLDAGLARVSSDSNGHGHWRLTDAGYAHADSIGPWLVSPQVRTLMAETASAAAVKA